MNSNRPGAVLNVHASPVEQALDGRMRDSLKDYMTSDRHLATHVLLLILAASFAVHTEAQASIGPFTFAEPCANNERFDINTLECIVCDSTANKVADVYGGGRQCQCTQPFRAANPATFSTTLMVDYAQDFVCVACGVTSSRDGTVCMGCDASTGATFNTTDCSCPNDGFALTEFSQTGQRLANKACVACPSNGRVLSNDRYTCQLCPHPNQTMDTSGTCTCAAGFTKVSDEQRATCVENAIVDPDHSVTYYEVRTSDNAGRSPVTVVSAVFADLFTLAATNCVRFRNRTSCNALANMCALQMYDSSTTACAQFIALQNGGIVARPGGYTNWQAGLPWLFRDVSVLDSTNLFSELSLTSTSATEQATRSKVSVLKFMLAKYALNGTYLGMEELTTQLQLCGGDPALKVAFLDVGSIFENECDIVLNDLLVSNSEPLLYDLYYVDLNNKLFPVPVWVKTARTNGVETQTSSYTQLYGRFFLWDKESSKESLSGSATVLQFAQHISLEMRLQDDPDLLAPPLLIITYSARPTDRINGQEKNANTLSSGSFKTTYSKNLSSFQLALVILLVLAIVAILLLWCRKEFVVWQYIADTEDASQFFLRSVVWLLGSAGDVFYWLVFAVSCYCFIFFKLQQTAFFLLPADDSSETTMLITFVVLAFFCKLVDVVALLWRQINADLFFVDWEKPRMSMAVDHFDQKQPDQATVSAWRKIFVTNKWNELQVERLVNVPVSLFLMILFLRGVGLEYLANSTPNAVELNGTFSPTNPILRFCINSFFWMLFAVLQMLWRHLVYHRYVEDKAAQFVDLLTWTNVSCFIFDAHRRFYYIHGKTVHSHADASLGEMNWQINTEEKQWTRQRGLVNGQDTFEVYCSKPFRARYDKHALVGASVIREQASATRRRKQAGSDQSNPANQTFATSPRLVKATQELNDFLLSFIEKTDPSHPWERRERDPYMVACGTPRTAIENPQLSVFYDDPEYNFTRTVLMGIEWDIIILLVLFYAVCDLLFANTFVNILMAYVLDRLIVGVRQYMGQKDIEVKTLVDKRFLI